MIPPFEPSGKLPPGIHWATWEEVVARFGRNEQRRNLLDGLARAIDALAEVGCEAIYVDGSFVTERPKPGDFDACWETSGVDLKRLDPRLLAYGGDRRDQKSIWGGELFPASGLATPYGTTFLDFFQMDKLTRRPKRIVAMRLKAPR